MQLRLIIGSLLAAVALGDPHAGCFDPTTPTMAPTPAPTLAPTPAPTPAPLTGCALFAAYAGKKFVSLTAADTSGAWNLDSNGRGVVASTPATFFALDVGGNAYGISVVGPHVVLQVESGQIVGKNWDPSNSPTFACTDVAGSGAIALRVDNNYVTQSGGKLMLEALVGGAPSTSQQWVVAAVN